MRKKIILTVTTDLNYDQRMQRIAETLSAEFDVTLVGRKKKKSKPLPDNFPYKAIRLNTWLESGKGFYLIYNFRLFIYLIFTRTHIITATDLDTLPACSLASRVKKVKLGFDAHEWFTELPELNNRPLIRNIWLKIERWFVPGVDFAYTVNQSIASLYQSRFNKKFSVIRNMPFRSLNPHSELSNHLSVPKIILYQGVLNVGRGLESMIEAMDQLENFELHLAGEGDISDQLRKQAASNQYPERIVFHGYLLPEILKKLTANAWIGINLLENISLNYYYSLANKFFDYVQASIPQITMKFPEYELLNKEIEVALLLNEISVPEILHAVSNVNITSQYEFLSTNCKSAARIWCWENEKNSLLKMYRAQFE